jgi:hypothetical protein
LGLARKRVRRSRAFTFSLNRVHVSHHHYPATPKATLYPRAGQGGTTCSRGPRTSATCSDYTRVRERSGGLLRTTSGGARVTWRHEPPLTLNSSRPVSRPINAGDTWRPRAHAPSLSERVLCTASLPAGRLLARATTESRAEPSRRQPGP